jgi:hypothetical protein
MNLATHMPTFPSGQLVRREAKFAGFIEVRGNSTKNWL